MKPSIANMELTVANDEKSFDPTPPKLKSSPIPISFISFIYDYCGNEYSMTILSSQKYCKNCLFEYISHITDNNTYLDVHIHVYSCKKCSM